MSQLNRLLASTAVGLALSLKDPKIGVAAGLITFSLLELYQYKIQQDVNAWMASEKAKGTILVGHTPSQRAPGKAPPGSKLSDAWYDSEGKLLKFE